MEPASLALGVIPVVVGCLKLAFSIQRICQNLRGSFQTKKDELCTQIDDLLEKMMVIKDVKPVGHALEEDVMKLKSTLGILQQDLETLISRSWFKRIFSYEEIGRGLDEALGMVARCETSFQTSCACYLVETGETLRMNVEASVLATANNTGAIMVSMEELRNEMKKLEDSLRPQTTSEVSVTVRYLGGVGGEELQYDVKPTDTVACVIKRMREENLNVNNIHLFSWSQHRHGCTNSGQTWRYRTTSTRLSTIRNECGKQDGQDVSWRLEYVRRAGTFTLFLIHGVRPETGVLMPHPVDTILEHLQQQLSIPNLGIVECRNLENGAVFDWMDMQALSQVMPYRCSLCVKLEEVVV